MTRLSERYKLDRALSVLRLKEILAQAQRSEEIRVYGAVFKDGRYHLHHVDALPQDGALWLQSPDSAKIPYYVNYGSYGTLASLNDKNTRNYFRLMGLKDDFRFDEKAMQSFSRTNLPPLDSIAFSLRVHSLDVWETSKNYSHAREGSTVLRGIHPNNDALVQRILDSIESAPNGIHDESQSPSHKGLEISYIK